MKILNFDEYVSESLWKKAIERSKTGEDRIEDKVITNIKDLKKIDLGFPFVFADEDLEVNHNSFFTWEDYIKLKPIIKKSGWRLPRWDEIGTNFFKSRYPDKLNDTLVPFDTKESFSKGCIVNFKSQSTEETLTFIIDNEYGQGYWCEWSKRDIETKGVSLNNVPNARIFRISNPKYNISYISCENCNKTDDKDRIRLIQDK